MTRRVVSIAPDASITEAMRLMLQHEISGLPVIDRTGKLVGIVTEGDFLRRGEPGTGSERPHWIEVLIGPEKLADEYVRRRDRKVSDVMTSDPVTITDGTSIEDAVRLMEGRRIKRLLVTRQGEVVGVISRTDLLRALSRAIRQASNSAMIGERSRSREAQLESQLWMHRIRP